MQHGPPRVCVEDPGEDSEQSGFTSAIFAEKRDDFALGDRERHIVEHDAPAEAFTDSLHREDQEKPCFLRIVSARRPEARRKIKPIGMSKKRARSPQADVAAAEAIDQRSA